MILEITGLERGTQKAKSSGKDLTGLNVTGIKFDRDGNEEEEYSKFLMDWKNADEIGLLEEYGVGARVELVNEKDGNFWNLTGVELIEEGNGKPTTREPAAKKEPAAKAAANPTTATPSPEVAVAGTSEEAIRRMALTEAVALTDAILSSDERFKKLLPATKTTVEIVSQMTLENASKFEAFIKGESTSVESKDTDLDKAGVDAEEPALPGDED